jgi:hypothetical protein
MAEPRPAPPELSLLGESDHVFVETPDRSFHCDSCGRTFSGEPGGAGLFVWTRGDEVRYEEPPLCDHCAYEISIGALIRWSVEEEEEG